MVCRKERNRPIDGYGMLAVLLALMCVWIRIAAAQGTSDNSHAATIWLSGRTGGLLHFEWCAS